MWFKVDDRFPRHPKTRASARALGGKHARARVMAFWLEAGTHSCEFLTDGFISDADVADFDVDDDPVAVAKALVTGGLWLRVEHGYRFHQWDHHQPSAESVKEKRERDRLRKAGHKHGLHGAQSLLTEAATVVEGVVVESADAPPLLAVESAAIPSGIRTESEALARARSRPDPSPCSSRAEERGALARRARPAPARLRLSIWQVRPNIHAAVHALVRQGTPYLDVEGRPDETAIFERVRDIVTSDLKAEYETTRELQSIVDSALGQYRSEREAGLALASFRRSEGKTLARRVRRHERLG